MCGECGCQCGCEAGGKFHRRHFLTKEEKIEHLETYSESLKKELSAVAEKIKELKN